MIDQDYNMDLKIEEDNFFVFLDYLKEEEIEYTFDDVEIINGTYIVKMSTNLPGVCHISAWESKMFFDSIKGHPNFNMLAMNRFNEIMQRGRDRRGLDR